MLLVLYYYDISEGKGTTAVRHSASVKRLGVKCIVTGEDTINSELAGEGSVKDTEMI